MNLTIELMNVTSGPLMALIGFNGNAHAKPGFVALPDKISFCSVTRRDRIAMPLQMPGHSSTLVVQPGFLKRVVRLWGCSANHACPAIHLLGASTLRSRPRAGGQAFRTHSATPGLTAPSPTRPCPARTPVCQQRLSRSVRGPPVRSKQLSGKPNSFFESSYFDSARSASSESKSLI